MKLLVFTYILGSWDGARKTIIKMETNTITQTTYKTANVAQDQLEHERWK